MSGNLRFDALIVGNVGIDTNVYLPSHSLDLRTPGHFTENLDCVGQAGGFSARGFARLGYRTAFLGYIGEDLCGELIRREFSRDGIDTRGLMIDPAGTGRSVNLVYPDGSRISFYDGKGHMRLEPNLEPSRHLLEGSHLAHFSIPNWARLLLPAARDAGCVISCDLQDIPDPADSYRQDFIHHSDILFFSGANLESPEALFDPVLRQYPKKILLAGLGEKGCALATEKEVRYFPPFTMDRPISDTNGAGDSLAVGFLAAYVLEHKSLEDSVRQGQICARYACGKRGDSSDLITRQQLAYYRSS